MWNEKEESVKLLEPFRSKLDPTVYDFALNCISHHSVEIEEESISSLLLPVFSSFKNLQDEQNLQNVLYKIDELMSSFVSKQNKQEGNKLIPLEAPVHIQEIISATHTKLQVDTEFASVGKSSELRNGASKKKSKVAEKFLNFGPYIPEYSLDNLESFDSRGKSRDLKIDSFDISIPGKRILVNASLTLAFGRKYGLVGRNGIGKSTLLRYLSSRQLPVPKYLTILHVEQEMSGDDTPAIQSVLRAHALREFLLKEEELLNQRLLDENLSEDMKSKWISKLNYVMHKLTEIESDKAESRAAMILSGLGFHPDSHNNPTKSFSGGWRMRLSLAGALLCQPDILLLDEPTNMLDIPAVIWLEKYLTTWNGTVLVVSHDKSFLDNIATDILHLHNETLDSYKGNFTQFLVTKEERVKNLQREYDAQMQYRQHLQEFIDRWRYNAKRASQAQSKIKILEKLPPLKPIPTEPVIYFTFPPVDPLPPPIIMMDEVSFWYDKSKPILTNVSISLVLDSRVAIVGPNGAGKSTLLKLMADQLYPTNGLCRRNGKLRFAFFTQHHVDQLDLECSPVEYMNKKYPNKSEEECRRCLGAFGIGGPLGTQKIGTLSGGQKSRVVFAMMSLINPHVLLLDEPTNHLDMDSIDALLKALEAYKGAVVVVSHDQKFIKSCCSEIWTCSGGSVKRFNGEIEDYVSSIIPA